MNLKNKNILIFGLGISGQTLIQKLHTKKCNIFIFDDNRATLNEVKNEHQFCTIFDEFSIDNLKKIFLVIISPAISIFDDRIIYAKANKVKVLSEQEFTQKYVKFKKLVSITGSNGKTTTATLTDFIFANAKVSSVLVGNVGKPICSLIDKSLKSVVINEVSSFQLESAKKFNTHISCVLNICPNHLDRHKTMTNYLFAKRNITRNQTRNNYLLLNADDDYFEYFLQKTKAKVLFVSLNKVVKGCYVQNGKIYCNMKKCEYICDTKDIKLNQKHNLYNSLFAILICKLFKIKNSYITKSLSIFTGVAHRNEYVATIDGVKYINDSKCTTVGALNSALQNYDNIILIMGGVDKGFAYEEIFENNKVKKYILFGSNRQKILEASPFNNRNAIELCENLIEALNYAKKIAQNGDTVLFSPASSSFDQYENFEKRGEHFKELVKSYEKIET